MCRGGRWYSVCTPSNFLANVVCRQLDYCDDRSQLDYKYDGFIIDLNYTCLQVPRLLRTVLTITRKLTVLDTRVI